MIKAFSLIELLISITIIILLISILLPSLHYIKYKSYSVICQNNIRNIYNSTEILYSSGYHLGTDDNGILITYEDMELLGIDNKNALCPLDKISNTSYGPQHVSYEISRSSLDVYMSNILNIPTDTANQKLVIIEANLNHFDCNNAIYLNGRLASFNQFGEEQ